MLPTLEVIDDAVPVEELLLWQSLVAQHRGTQSTGYREKEIATNTGGLHARVRERMGEATCLHVLIFAIERGMETEMHRDEGEYAALFYPIANPLAPLRIDRGAGEELIEVAANRLVFLDVTTIRHQQVVPSDASVRYSVAFKFARPEV
jgi:hypothetical protein